MTEGNGNTKSWFARHPVLSAVIVLFVLVVSLGALARAITNIAELVRLLRPEETVMADADCPPQEPVVVELSIPEVAATYAMEDDKAVVADEEPEGPGRISIDSEPWATAYIDGRLVGETPLVADVEPGEHHISLRCEGKGDKVTKSLSVDAGKTTPVYKRFADVQCP